MSGDIFGFHDQEGAADIRDAAKRTTMHRAKPHNKEFKIQFKMSVVPADKPALVGPARVEDLGSCRYFFVQASEVT